MHLYLLADSHADGTFHGGQQETEWVERAVAKASANFPWVEKWGTRGITGDRLHDHSLLICCAQRSSSDMAASMMCRLDLQCSFFAIQLMMMRWLSQVVDRCSGVCDIVAAEDKQAYTNTEAAQKLRDNLESEIFLLKAKSKYVL